MRNKTHLMLNARDDNLAQGSYEVRFKISQVNAAGSLKIDANGVQSTCALTQQLSYSGPIQTCTIGPIPVAADGKFALEAVVVGQGPQNWELDEVTVATLP
jgi:hypothetical protein